MYPQTVVPSGDELHTTLTNGMDVAGSGVIFTGDYYTANKDDIGWNPNDVDNTEEENPVYEYENERYVRVTPYRYDANSYYNDRVANPENIEQVIAAAGDGAAAPRWFKVEPIKWIVLNYNKSILENTCGIAVTEPTLLATETYELLAADAIMSGIPFGIANHTTWEGSLIYQYLNDDFYNQAFSLNEQGMIQISRIFNNTTAGENTNVTGLNQNTLPDGLTGLNSTDQNIYLLSRYELSNADSPYVNSEYSPVFVSAINRQTIGTDYARAHYLILSSGFCQYWTRAAHSNGTSVYRIASDGSVGTNGSNIIFNGTRPALTIFCFAL